MRVQTFAALMVAILAFGQLAVAAENWPQWRGPWGTGVAAEGEYPIQFSSKQNVAWNVKLPGLGTSTPAVWGEKVFLTCGVDRQDTAICYDMQGTELWRHALGPERAGKRAHASGSNPSPVTDGERVVVYFKSGTVACLDLNGKEQWKLNLQQRYGEDTLWWDLGTSPVLAGNAAIIAVIQEGHSYLVALDLVSGDVLWKTPREYDRPRESDQAYTTPSVVKLNGHDVIVTWGADHLTGHAAETGELLWECGGFNPENQGMWRVIASAAVEDGMAVVPYGRGGYLAGVRLGGNGDITASNRVWEKAGRNIGADVATPAIRDGRVYIITDGGEIVCRDVKTGEEIWSHRLPRHRDPFWASPVLAGDLLYAARFDGTVFVGRVNDDGFKLLAENPMDEILIATPVPIRNGLLIRGEEHLFRIESNER